MGRNVALFTCTSSKIVAGSEDEKSSVQTDDLRRARAAPAAGAAGSTFGTRSMKGYRRGDGQRELTRDCPRPGGNL
jgi:hypothetical protein